MFLSVVGNERLDLIHIGNHLLLQLCKVLPKRINAALGNPLS